MYLIQLMHVKGIEQFDIIKSNPSKINSEPIPQKQIPDDENLEKADTEPKEEVKAKKDNNEEPAEENTEEVAAEEEKDEEN